MDTRFRLFGTVWRILWITVISCAQSKVLPIRARKHTNNFGLSPAEPAENLNRVQFRNG
jgi:hypothetical protein